MWIRRLETIAPHDRHIASTVLGREPPSGFEALLDLALVLLAGGTFGVAPFSATRLPARRDFRLERLRRTGFNDVRSVGSNIPFPKQVGQFSLVPPQPHETIGIGTTSMGLVFSRTCLAVIWCRRSIRSAPVWSLAPDVFEGGGACRAPD